MNRTAYIRCAGCGQLFKPKRAARTHCPTCTRYSKAMAHVAETTRILREERKSAQGEHVRRGLRVIKGGRHG